MAKPHIGHLDIRLLDGCLMNKKIITIDGPAGSGKTTVGKMLEAALGGQDRNDCACISSGLVYRMLAKDLISGNMLAKHRKKGGVHALNLMMKDHEWKFHGTEIACSQVANECAGGVTEIFYGKEIDKASSQVAKNPTNRKLVADFLKVYIENVTRFDKKGGVLEKEDSRLASGWKTMRCLKYIVVEGRDIGSVVFPEARWKIYLDASLATRVGRRNKEREGAGDGISTRDREDMERKASPLVVPSGAYVIDSTSIGLNEVVKKIVNYVKKS